jgi:two-component system, NarL family, invasion response regulator UvrY
VNGLETEKRVAYNGPEVDVNRPGTDGAMTQAATSQKVRVLIVDDHAVVRAGFRQLIESTADLEVAGEAGTAGAALSLIGSHPCDVMLLDISLPDASVLDTVAALRRRQPELPILIVSMHPEEQYAVNLLRAGASGFFSKAGEAGDLLEAIRTVAAGRKYVSTSLAEALALAATGDAPAPPHRQLSNREFQIFVQLAAGKTVTDIADEMCLSVKTISTYRSRIFEKMDFSRNADLTAYALRHNLMN